MTECLLYCPVCRGEFNWHKGYDEADWRRTLSIVGKEYYPRKKREEGQPDG
jgi:hypothetical protein